MAVRHVLSIDGGGVRGIVAAIVLEALDAEFKAIGKSCRVADCFNLIAGTSSGAIVAAGLALPRPGGGEASPTTIRSLFESRSREIFPQRWFCEIPILGRLPQLFGPFYSPRGLSDVLHENFASMAMADARRNLMIAAYSIDPRDIVLFRGGPAYETSEVGHRFGLVPVTDALLGSTAAPTFFPPHKVVMPEGPDETGADHWTAIDGAIYINDPAMAALTEAIRLFPGDDFHVVSLGAGRETRNYPFRSARRWGFSQWVSPISRFRTPLLSAISDGQARAVNRQLHYLLGKEYIRFDYRLERGRGSDRIDDSSRGNIARLTRGALEMVDEMRPQLRQLAEKLDPVY
ncbi:MAG: patatin-like phospholipase family protein [Pseudomonadota bacterium]